MVTTTNDDIKAPMRMRSGYYQNEFSIQKASSAQPALSKCGDVWP